MDSSRVVVRDLTEEARRHVRPGVVRGRLHRLCVVGSEDAGLGAHDACTEGAIPRGTQDNLLKYRKKDSEDQKGLPS